MIASLESTFKNCHSEKLWVLWTWIDLTSVYFHDRTLTCRSAQQFERHLPTACRAMHQQHLFVSLLPCFSVKSQQQNTLNWWKYCSKMSLCMNCCCCNHVTTCHVETWRTAAWCQILWCFYARREFCDVFILTTYECWRFMSWWFSIVCGGGMVMRVHSHHEIFWLGWWEYTHTKRFSNLSRHWNTTGVMRVHSHQEIFQFICEIEARQGLIEEVGIYFTRWWVRFIGKLWWISGSVTWVLWMRRQWFCLCDWEVLFTLVNSCAVLEDCWSFNRVCFRRMLLEETLCRVQFLEVVFYFLAVGLSCRRHSLHPTEMCLVMLSCKLTVCGCRLAGGVRTELYMFWLPMSFITTSIESKG